MGFNRLFSDWKWVKNEVVETIFLLITNSSLAQNGRFLRSHFQEESNELTVRYTGVVLNPLKPRICLPRFASTNEEAEKEKVTEGTFDRELNRQLYNLFARYA
jgi:hypothetical protein